jgi:scyllo-inositol 2-dehydrogenase (NADP+)
MSGFLVVGGGKMGLSHLAILNRLLDRGQVAVVDPSRLTRFIFGRIGIRTFASLDAALAASKTWAGAVVATPTASHYSIARTLLERGIPCFIEKPLTLDPTRSSALLELQQQRATVAQMGFVLRFVQPFVRLRAIVQSGVLGAPLEYRARMLGNVVTKPENDSWRTDFQRGGGCLNEYGPHLIDLCRAIFGDVQTIERAAFGRVHSTRGDDHSDIQWRHSQGAVGTLRLDWCDTSRRKSYTDFDVQFEHGRVHANIAEIRVEPAPEANLDMTQLAALTAPTLPFPVNFYLRGEEFTLQLELFLERVLGRKLMRADIPHDLAADLVDGHAVDQLIFDTATLGGLA